MKKTLLNAISICCYKYIYLFLDFLNVYEKLSTLNYCKYLKLFKFEKWTF